MIQEIDIDGIVARIRAVEASGGTPAFVYDRISSTGQEGGLSLVYQADGGDRYASERGLTIVHTFSVTESARREGRRVFGLMFKLAQRHGVKHVIFKNTDRYARNYADLVLLERLVDEEGFSLHFYQNNRVITADSNHNDRMILGIDMTVAKYLSDKISHDIRESNKYKARRGIAPCPRSPWGYRYDREKKLHIIDRSRERDVRWIMDRFDAGDISVRSMARLANEHGVLSPSGGKWSTPRLHEVLTSPFYHGEFTHHGTTYPGTHEPYYPKSRYEARVERLASRYAPRKGGRSYSLASILKCGACGRTMTGDVKKGRYTYYVHKCPAAGKQASLTVDSILAMVAVEVERIRLSEAYSESLKAVFRDIVAMKERSARGEINAYQTKITHLENKRQKLIDLYAEGAIDRDALDRQIKLYNAQIRNLEESRISRAELKIDVMAKIAEAIDILRRFPEAFATGTPEEQCDLLADMAERVTIGESGASIEWKKPISFLTTPEIIGEEARVRICRGMHLQPDDVRTLSICVHRFALHYAA